MTVMHPREGDPLRGPPEIQTPGTNPADLGDTAATTDIIGQDKHNDSCFCSKLLYSQESATSWYMYIVEVLVV